MKLAYLGGGALAVLALAFGVPASAQVYGAVDAGAMTMAFDSAPMFDDAHFAVVGGRLGWKANRWVGVEGDLFLGLKEDRVFDRPPVSVKLSGGGFVYGVAVAPIGERVDLIGRIGWGHMVGGLKGAGMADGARDGAVSYGFGAQYNLDANQGVRLDYTHYAVRDLPISGVAVAYIHAF